MKSYKMPLIAAVTVSALSNANLFAVTVPIDSSNFDRTEGSGIVATSYTDISTNHGGLEYIGSTDFLSAETTFELTFNFTGSAAGAAFWFGDANDNNWIFLNRTSTGATQIRDFDGRNLETHSGGSASLIVDGFNLNTSTDYTLTVNRTISGSTINLAVSLSEGATSIASGNTSYTGPDASWGITAFAPGAGDTINFTGLEITTIPEPSTYGLITALGAFACVAYLRRRRR